MFPAGWDQLANIGRRQNLRPTLDGNATVEDRDTVGHAPHLFHIVRHHQHRRSAAGSRRRQDAVENPHRRVIESRGRFVQDQKLGFRIQCMREQHAAQFAAGEHGKRPLAKAGQPDQFQQPRDRCASAPRHAQAHGPALSCEREKVGDGDGQGRIDREALRHVADGSCPDPVHGDPSVERDLSQHRREQRALARSVGAHQHVNAPPPHPQTHIVEQSLLVPADGEAVDFEERRRVRRIGHASVTSARIIVSTLRCISRSNLSAVYSPDAMCVMM